MTVAELIEELSDLPPAATVTYGCEESERFLVVKEAGTDYSERIYGI